MGKHHAVTGAFGFSGKYLTRRLLAAGKSVITLTNSPNRPNPFDRPVEARPFRFDSPSVLSDSLADVEVLYNTYWVRFNHQGLFSHAEAVDNTLILFEAAKNAGVRRIVHVSITNADENSPLEYFSGKGLLERKLAETGIPHTIVRPAVLFGPEDILINNIAWTLRHFPAFAMFGDGRYHIQPIYVDDLAKLMFEAGEAEGCATINAVGPEDYAYVDLVRMIRKELDLWRPIVKISPELGYQASLLVGKLVGDIFVTREEITGLMADTLHAPGAAPTGETRLSDWVRANKANLGKKYASELARRIDRTKAY